MSDRCCHSNFWCTQYSHSCPPFSRSSAHIHSPLHDATLGASINRSSFFWILTHLSHRTFYESLCAVWILTSGYRFEVSPVSELKVTKTTVVHRSIWRSLLRTFVFARFWPPLRPPIAVPLQLYYLTIWQSSVDTGLGLYEGGTIVQL